MIDLAHLKLGKLPKKPDERTLKLARYHGTLPPPPASLDLTTTVKKWGMFRNGGETGLGDCAIAAPCHMIQGWRSTNDDPAESAPTDAGAVAAYSDVSGYDPKTGVNDNGCAELDVLNYWRKSPGICGHEIIGFAELDVASFTDLKVAIYLFGSAYIGFSLPVTIQDQDKVWDLVPSAGKDGEPGSLGGHAVAAFGYNSDNGYRRIVSWDQVFDVTPRFWAACCDESYAVVSQDAINRISGLSASGFELDALLDDIKAFG